jgi:hypothetical protein
MQSRFYERTTRLQASMVINAGRRTTAALMRACLLTAVGLTPVLTRNAAAQRPETVVDSAVNA